MEEKEIKEIEKKAVEKYKDSQSFQIIEFAKQMQQSIINENLNTKNKTKFYNKYSSSVVDGYLADPQRYEAELRNVSRWLEVSSPHYWRLLNYFPSIAVLSPVLMPLDTEKLIKNSGKALKQFDICGKLLDNMNVSHEYLKVLKTIFREDVFYGYEIETDDSYYIKPLNPKYCRLSGVYDGCFTFEFDFSYFASQGDIEQYSLIDKEFQAKYNAYVSDSNLRWQELNVEKEICVKLQESLDFCCPPFIATFYDLYDIVDYKELNKAKVEMGNNRFLGLNMETRNDTQKPDDFKLDTNTMRDYYTFISSCLSGTNIGLFMSPMPFKEISFPEQKSEVDTVANATRNYWSSTGVADVLVGENKNAGTLKYSIKTDEALLFDAYKQIERILSRKIKRQSGGLYEVMLPEFTMFNIEDEFNKYLKASEYGFGGAKTMVEATLRLSQNKVRGLEFLENTVLKKLDNMMPVQSTHTQSSETSNGGKPSKKDGDLTDSGQTNKDNSTDENK